MAGRKRLSERQTKMLDFIRRFTGDNGFPPTIREIGEAVDISSTSVVNYNLDRLEEGGYLRREKEISRGLSLTSNAPDLVPARGVIRIPLAGAIAAGQPIDIGDKVFDEEDAIELTRDLLPRLDQQSGQLYALRVSGESMIDAMVNDGDIVIMRYQQEARNGEMVAAWLNDRQETTLKYFFKEADRVRLQPANPTMDPIYLDPAVVQIQGKVLMVVRQLA